MTRDSVRASTWRQQHSGRKSFAGLLLVLALLANLLPLASVTPAALASKADPFAAAPPEVPAPEAGTEELLLTSAEAFTETVPVDPGTGTDEPVVTSGEEFSARGRALDGAMAAPSGRAGAFLTSLATLVQSALVNPTTVLGTQPLIFDPADGSEVQVGWITFEMGTGSEFNMVQVTYLIDEGYRAQYDLQDVRTTINAGDLGDSGLTALPEYDEYTYTHTFTLPVPLPEGVTSLVIEACATIRSNDVSSVSLGLPSIGTVKVDTNGNIVAPSSYFDTVINPGAIPASTDTGTDTVTFNPDPNWATGDIVRVVASYKAIDPANTGLVTVPTTPDATASKNYYVRNLGSGVYSFYSSYN